MSSLLRQLASPLILMVLGGCCLTPVAEGRDAGGHPGICSPPCIAASGYTCLGGTCVCANPALRSCPATGGGKQCVDLQNDPNCGACGNVCDALSGLICRDGACICGAAGFGFCPSLDGTRICRNLKSDPSNCGVCSHVCTGGNCLSGNCR